MNRLHPLPVCPRILDAPPTVASPPLPVGIYHTEVIVTGLAGGTPGPNVVTVTLTHDPMLRG